MLSCFKYNFKKMVKLFLLFIFLIIHGLVWFLYILFIYLFVF